MGFQFPNPATNLLCDQVVVTVPLCASVSNEEVGTVSVFLKADSESPASESPPGYLLQIQNIGPPSQNQNLGVVPRDLHFGKNPC